MIKTVKNIAQWKTSLIALILAILDFVMYFKGEQDKVMFWGLLGLSLAFFLAPDKLITGFRKLITEFFKRIGELIFKSKV